MGYPGIGSSHREMERRRKAQSVLFKAKETKINPDQRSTFLQVLPELEGLCLERDWVRWKEWELYPTEHHQWDSITQNTCREGSARCLLQMAYK